jgi:hypothetical protein
MTEHYDELSVAPGPARAEALRQRLHARLASGTPDVNQGQPRLHIGTAGIDAERRLVPMKEIDVSDNNSTGSDDRNGWRLAMAAAAVVAVIAVTGIAFAINNSSNDDEPPAPAATVAPTTTVASPPSTGSSAGVTAVDDHGALDGRWRTGPVPIDQVKAAMLRAGLTQDLVDEWVLEVGSPTEYSFTLDLHQGEFSHSESTPDTEQNVTESGTFVYAADHHRLDLSIAGQGDTYEFSTITSCCDGLQLVFVDSTDDGTAEDKAMHARYAIAFYTSAKFNRTP